MSDQFLYTQYYSRLIQQAQRGFKLVPGGYWPWENPWDSQDGAA
jgi:hypothetical protein